MHLNLPQKGLAGWQAQEPNSMFQPLEYIPHGKNRLATSEPVVTAGRLLFYILLEVKNSRLVHTYISILYVVTAGRLLFYILLGVKNSRLVHIYPYFMWLQMADCSSISCLRLK